MSYKRSALKKWQQFMTEIMWEGNNNWKIVDENFLQQQIPLVDAWARRNILLINDHDVRISFKKFFWSDDKMSQHDYTRKNQAVYALMALYAYQQKEEHGN